MWNLSISGEQLVRKQEDPLQEEHREGPRGGQHVRRQGCRRSHLSWQLSRSDDVPGVSVVLVQRRRILRRILVSTTSRMLVRHGRILSNQKLHNES